jgi:hypothetical protein
VDWQCIAVLDLNGSGRISVTDGAVRSGHSYTYRLGVTEGAVERFGPDIAVYVPNQMGLAITQVAPNPSSGSFRVSIQLAFPEVAILEIVDIAGRCIHSTTIGRGETAFHDVTVTLRSARHGVYFIRLIQGKMQVTSRVILAW